MATHRILKTYNYDMFTLNKFNRDVRNTKKLEASMRKHGFIPAYAIHVERRPNGKLSIKEGHHRYKVALKLHLPIYYVICHYNATPQETAESNRAWDLRDYLASWAKLGNEAYLAVLKYWEETGIPLNHCIGLLSGVSAGTESFRQAFKEGRYRLGDPFHADTIKDLVFH
jgi:hypothetical protein